MRRRGLLGTLAHVLEMSIKNFNERKKFERI